MGTCDSCGATDEHLTPVHRVYLSTEPTAADRVVDEIERWCIPCLTSYPHRTAG
jgi:hypothetical protein